MEYKYIASDQKTGKRVTAFATAETVASLVDRLKTEGLLPIKIYEAHTLVKKRDKVKMYLGRGSIKSKDLAIFTRQLSATLSAGLLLTESLETIAYDLENEYFSKIITQIKEDIQAGEDFSAALAKHPKIFSMPFIAVVKSGEATGRLDLTMKNLAQYLEDLERLKEKVLKAIRYPLFVFGFAMVVVTVIVLFLIPKFAGMFSQFDAQLPLLTRIVVGTSEVILHNILPILVGIIGIVFLYFYLTRFYKFRYFIDHLKLKIPYLGKNIIHKALIAQFCRTFGFLLSGAVGLSVSLDITAQVVDHLLMQEAIEEIRNRVVAGATISDEIRSHKIFPRLVAKMAGVGDKTGNLSEMFDRTATYYDEELDATLNNLTTILEPMLIIFVGGLVLIVVLALYLPIFQMATIVS